MSLLTFNFAFQTFFVVFALVCLWLYLSRSTKPRSQPWDRWCFWFFAGWLLAFAVLRPLGVSVDDEGYLVMFQRICTTLSCGEWIQGKRDRVWFSLVGLFKSFFPNPRVMLWVSGLGLLLKLWVIDRFCRQRCLALLAYMGMFYVVQDITALRVSVATGLYLLGFYGLVQGNKLQGGLALLGSGFLHVQGFLAPLLWFGRFWPPRLGVSLALILAPMVLLLAGLYPHAGWLKVFSGLPSGLALIQWLGQWYHSLPGAVASASAGVFGHMRSWPVVMPPTLLLALWWGREVFQLHAGLFRYAATSLMIASALHLVMAAIPHLQFRFWDFFLTPLVLVIGWIRPTRLNVLAVILLGGMYTAKYTWQHDLLLDASDCRKVSLLAPEGGRIRALVTEGNTCFNSPDLAFIRGTRVLFQTVPDPGVRWGEWTAGCVGQGGQCSLVIEDALTVAAQFIPVRTLNLEMTGKGTITTGDPKKSCKRPCQLRFDQEARVILTAKPEKNFRWVGWSGACVGSDPVCEITLSEDRNLAARFVAQWEVVVTATPGGRVFAEDAGLLCPGSCQAILNDGTPLRPRAEAETGFRFAGWNGACQGVDPVCTLTVNGKKKITARFERLSGP